MNREYFSTSTKNVLIHLKEYNYKLCRKGLLRRVEKLEITVGDFKRIENGFLEKSVRRKEIHITPTEMMKELNNEKLNTMGKEINILESALKGLLKTIGNIKNDVKSRVSGRIFDMWSNRVDNIEKRFKKLYSDMNNDFYNYVYKTLSYENDSWYSVINDVNWIKENIFTEFDEITDLIDGFEEGDLSNLFSMEAKKALKRGSSGGGKSKCVAIKKTKAEVNIVTKTDVTRSVSVLDNDQFDDISSEEEGAIINDALRNDVDEVGEVDIDGFGDMLERYV